MTDLRGNLFGNLFWGQYLLSYTSHSLLTIVKVSTCFKLIFTICIGLIITNQKGIFIESCTFENSSSDYHKVITTILKKTICKENPKTKFQGDFKSFKKDRFEEELKSRMMSLADSSFSHFGNISLETQS